MRTLVSIDEVKKQIRLKYPDELAKKIIADLNDIPKLTINVSNLEFVRTINGLTRRDLAKLSGVSDQTIYRIETAQGNGRWATMKFLADALKVDVSLIS